MTEVELTPEDRALLSLDDEACAMRDALMEVGRALLSAEAMAHRAPLAAWQFNRMTHPEVGDWVMETTGFRRGGADSHRSFGILLTLPEEDFGAWRIQYGPGELDIMTWENAAFIALPIRNPTWWRPLVLPSPAILVPRSRA